MVRAAGLGILVAAAFAASAFAAGPPASLKATVKDTSSTSRLVTIHNGSKQTFKGFFINSTDAPKITATDNKTCKMGTSPWKSNGKKHVDYWTDCGAAVKPGKTLKIKLTTSGKGTIIVWAKVKGVQYKIGQGS